MRFSLEKKQYPCNATQHMQCRAMPCSGMNLMKMGPGKSAFLGYGPLATNFAVHVVEDGQDLDMGSGFGHFGIVLPVRCAALLW